MTEESFDLHNLIENHTAINNIDKNKIRYSKSLWKR